MHIALFSTGVPDASQGGSGIFNELVCDALFDRGGTVTAFFRVSDRFVRECDPRPLERLRARGLRVVLVDEKSPIRGVQFGFDFLRQNHQVAVCTETLRDHKDSLRTFDGALALDLGWALALSAARPAFPVVAILGDPLHHRMRWGMKPTWWSPHRLLYHIQELSLRRCLPRLRSALDFFDGKTRILGSFSPAHAAEWRSLGLACRAFRWFTADPGVEHITRPSRTTTNGLVALHVGALQTTASWNLRRYWAAKVLPALGRLPFPLEIRFVGKIRPTDHLLSHSKNLTLTYVGHREQLDDAFAAADVFLSPMRYPVGVRTRILTALSYGMPVLADPSASLGLPELVHDHDILYASTPEEIVHSLKRMYDDPAVLVRIGASARMSWEHWFHPRTNIMTLLSVLGFR